MSSEYTPTFNPSEQAPDPANQPGSVLATASTGAPPSGDTESQPRSRKVWFWSLLTALLLGGGFIGWRAFGNQAKPAPQAPPPLPVQVETLEPGQIRSTGEFVGRLEAQERVSLQPQTQGRIERILVSNGDRVTQGTPIMLLSLDQTQANVTSAVAGVNSSQAALATAEAQLAAKQADRTKAAADVKLQQSNFRRTRYLVEQGAQTQQQLDTAQNNLDTTIATLDAAAKDVNAAQASVKEAQSNVQQSQAQVAANQVNLSQKQIVAPIDGMVGDFSVKVGDYASVGQTLTTIIKNDAFNMRISVPSNNVAQLRLGLPVELLDGNTGERLTTGSLSFISPQVDSSAQSILVTARFGNTDSKLRDGQYVRARIIWSQKSGILIPSQALNRIGGQNFVYVAQEEQSKDGKSQVVVHQKPVKLGEVQGDQYPVLEGIKVGDRIATSNILKLRDGVPIQPQSASAQPQSAPTQPQQ